MNQYINEVNECLMDYLHTLKPGKVREAMIYSVSAGGKRLRPLLFIQGLRSYSVDYRPYLKIACAIEMVHTYSLIHDDLPAMDDDDLRRGMPTCHKQFDEATAVLAGDALLNEAMNIILTMDLDDSLKVKICQLLFKASGASGMIYGQQQDMYYENHNASINELKDIHHHKTGCMIAVCLECAGMIACPTDIDKLSKLGFDMGLAFQIQDDILDVTSSTEVLGKPVGSDIDNNKTTYVSLLGLEKAQDYLKDLYEECLQDIYALSINHGLLIDMLNKIIKRVS